MTPDALEGPGRTGVLTFLKDPYRYYDQCRERFGERWTMRFPGDANPRVFSANPEDVAALYGMPGDNIVRGRESAVSELVGTGAMLALSGGPYVKRRKLLGPCFRGDRMAKLGHVMTDAAARVADRWTDGSEVVLFDQLQTMSLTVMARAVFGAPDDEDAFEALLGDMQAAMDKLSPALIFVKALRKEMGGLSAWGRFMRAKRAIDEVITDRVRAAQQAAEEGREPGADLLSLLAAARDDEGQGLSFEEIRDELHGLLLGGYLNVANHTSWALWFLGRHPDVEEQLRDELATVSEDDAGLADLARLPFLDAVVKETLRRYPPPEHYRRLKEDAVVGGVEVPAATTVITPIYLVHMSEALYDEPRAFRPERWLDPAANASQAPYAFLPFGGGIRKCPGDAFALLEIKLALAAILRRVKLDVLARPEVLPRRRRLEVVPTGGVHAVVRRLTPLAA